MNAYVKPDVEILYFSTEDVLGPSTTTTSNAITLPEVPFSPQKIFE